MGEEEWLAVLFVPPRLQAASVARTQAKPAAHLGAETKGGVPIRKGATTFCAPGYVSGTIHALKQGAALTSRLRPKRFASGRRVLSVLFMWMEE